MPPAKLTRRSKFSLASSVLLVLFYFWSRLYNLLALPLFMDEATHITRAQDVWQGKPFDLLLTGKAMAPYLAALLDPFHAAPWIGRIVVVLVGAVGLAAIIGLGRALHSRVAGLTAGILWVLCPYMFFFERMALVDATLASLAALLTWLAVRMIHTGRIRDALLCGLTLALCAFAKTTGIIYIVIPAGVALLLPRQALPHPFRAYLRRRYVDPMPTQGWGEVTGWSFRALRRDVMLRIRQTVLAYLVAVVLLAGPALYIRSQDANVFGIGTLASGESSSLGDRLRENPIKVMKAFRDYFQPWFLAFLLVSGVIGIGQYPRVGLLLAMLVVVPLTVLIVTATQLYLRYLVIVLPGVLILGAVGLAGLGGLKRLKWPIRALTWGVIGTWAVLFVWPFMATAYNDPAHLDLPTNDRFEYIEGWTAGFGLRDAAQDLTERAVHAQQPLRAVGMVGSCNTIRLYLPPDGPATIDCPDVWDGTSNGLSLGRKTLTQRANRDGSALGIAEYDGPVELDAIPPPNELVQLYPRPGRSYAVALFKVTGAD